MLSNQLTFIENVDRLLELDGLPLFAQCDQQGIAINTFEKARPEGLVNANDALNDL